MTRRPPPSLPPRRPALAVFFPLLLLLASCGAPEPGEIPIHGTLERDRIELRATASEPLVELAVREGDRVEAGQVVARLDPSRFDASLDGARARLARTEARLDELRRGGRDERRTEVRAAIDADRSELELARLEVGRLERLVAEDVAARDRLDAARTRLETTEAALERDRARLSELLEGATVEELRQAEADREAAAAEVADLEIARDRLTLRSPTSARVEALPWEPGEIPGVGTPVVVLLSSAPAWVRVHLPEDRMARMPVGTPMRLEADGLDSPLAGCLRFVSSEASFTPHFALSEYDRHRLAYRAEIEVVTDDGRAAELPTGLPVRATPDPGSASERCRGFD